MLVTDVVTGKYIEEAQPLKLQQKKSFLPTKSYNLYNLKKKKKSILAAQAFGIRGDKYITKKSELSLLHVTHLMVLTYASTKYYQTISNH